MYDEVCARKGKDSKYTITINPLGGGFIAGKEIGAIPLIFEFGLREYLSKYLEGKLLGFEGLYLFQAISAWQIFKFNFYKEQGQF